MVAVLQGLLVQGEAENAGNIRMAGPARTLVCVRQRSPAPKDPRSIPEINFGNHSYCVLIINDGPANCVLLTVFRNRAFVIFLAEVSRRFIDLNFSDPQITAASENRRAKTVKSS
jgi:hypothetical protein